MTAANTVGPFYGGVCQLSEMSIQAPLGSVFGLQLSSPMTSLTKTSSVVVEIRVERDCPDGSYLTASHVCQACEAGTYSLEFSPKEECRSCPAKSATCLGGDAFMTEDGFWRTSVLSDEMWACPMEKNCIGGTSGTNASFLGQCRAGSKGPLCGVCMANFFNAGYECMACEDGTSNENLSIVVVLVAMFGAVVAFKTRSARVRKNKSVFQILRCAVTNIIDGQRAKIAWQTIQITSAIAWTTSIKWPEPFQSFSALLTNLADLSLIPVDCISQNMNYWNVLVIATVVPVGLVASAWLIARLTPNRISSEKKAMTFTLFVAFLVLPTVSTKIFRTFL